MAKKVEIKGAIISNNDQWIYDWMDMEATSPKSVSKQLPQNDMEDIEVHINSGGGSVFAGSEIYTALKDYPGNVTVKIVGLAASAASVIAMAGDKVLISPTAQIMIHNASMVASGDYRDMDDSSKILRNTNEAIAKAYELKSGKDFNELLDMMNAETWLTAEQAVEANLADEVMFQQSVNIVASTGLNMLPEAFLDKIRDMKGQLFKEPVAKKDTSKIEAELEFLKLKEATIHE